MSEILPEGTDHVIPGAAGGTAEATDSSATGSGSGGASAREKLKSEAAGLKDRASGKASEFVGQASDKARDYAEQGKERASGALDEVARLIGTTADQIDEKLGANYGDYARRAADAVSSAAGTLRDKDVEELIDDARGAVRNSPAIAIGAAAAAGFLIARIIKAGSDALDAAAKDITPKATSSEADEVSAAARTAPKPRAPKAKSNPSSES